MRKAVLILTLAGGIIGVINNFVFYVTGVLTTIMLTHVLIPFLSLTSMHAEFERLIIINTVAASVLCIAAAVAGIFYYRGDSGSEQKLISKYTATIVFITVCAGLVLTFSFISLILFVIAAVFAIISVRDDYRKSLVPAGDSFRKAIIITVMLSLAVLVMLIILSIPWITGNI